ncbi:glycoside hydrolase family 97 protein [Marinifilum sp.]|uniref:glycoside hydrolase family 97 protein n=1 Tax=Marinifilum sp. TaxID=2033137 RepID=UPI003BADA60B
MRYLQLVILFLSFSLLAKGQDELKSPDGKIKLTIQSNQSLSFSAKLNGQEMINKAELEFLFNKESILAKNKFKSRSYHEKDMIKPVVSHKNSTVKHEYNALELKLNAKCSIQLRAYNEGVAYRYITNVKNEVEVHEKLEITFSDDYNSWASLYKTYQGCYQEEYTKLNVSQFPDTMYTYLPYLLGDKKGNKILITEADHYDYPHMFLKKGEKENQLTATFPPYPLETELYGDRRSRITKEADFIAKTKGTRSFPWRVFLLTENDGQLIESDMIYCLSRENKKKDNSWIKPGRVAWDWWNASNLYGVDFESGLNTKTWKYYIDFAAKNGLEYIILDEGWSVSTRDLTKANPETDLQYLIDYGKKKGVGIILWATWRALNEQWEVLDKFVEWGAAGIKVDFMDRADQWMVNFYEKAAKETYKRKLLIDFHGAFKPTGLRRSYPNIVSYEGVGGLEESKWSKQNTPEFNLELPFIRMVCGPMDYTPGAMRNFHSKEFKWNFNRPSSQGTRCHQIALFVIYESGVQMFADSPSNYEREQETTDFLTQIPNTWDETKVLEAKVGEYLVMARRKGNTWFLAGLTNDESREYNIDLSFLAEHKYGIEMMQDGINSDKFAEDYKISKKEINKHDKFKLKMNKEGGFVAIIKPL